MLAASMKSKLVGYRSSGSFARARAMTASISAAVRSPLRSRNRPIVVITACTLPTIAAAEAASAADEQAITRLQAAVDHFGADHADAAAAVAGVADFFRAVAAATGNRVVALTQEPLLLLLLAGLEIMIDQAPQARRRIATAQQHICAAIRAHDADAARDWMSRHIRDFRRGFEVSGIDLDSPVATPR